MLEKIAAARISSNLAQSRAELHTDIDTLTAAGAAGDMIFIEAQGAAGESGVRIVRELLGKIEGYVANTSYPAKPVALQVIKELLLCKCPACQGRGHIPASADGENERHHDCVICLGSGLPKIDKEARAEAAGAYKYTPRIEQMYAKIRAWVAKREYESLANWYRITR